MVCIINVLKSNYFHILIFLGILIFAYSILTSNRANKKYLGKILGCLITIVGCICMYIEK